MVLCFQVLDAWFGQANQLVGLGLHLTENPTKHPTALEEGKTNLLQTGLVQDQVLSEIMDLVVDALVHPSKLVSSTAPGLLERAVNLRQVSMPDGLPTPSAGSDFAKT